MTITREEDFKMESCATIYVRHKSGKGTQVLAKSFETGESYSLLAKKKPKESLHDHEEEVLQSYNHSRQLLSLLDSTLSFVAANFNLVDSLVNFPEEIGKRIWHKLSTSPMKRTQDCLRIFGQAYPTLFLSQLKVHSLLFLNEYEEKLLLMMTGVRKLDLAHCNLGDHHDLLPFLHSLEHLEVLILKRNNLTHVSIAKLFNPLVLKRGFVNLKYLDLSSNPIFLGKTCHMKILDKLESLDFLVLSEKSLKGDKGNFLDRFQRSNLLCDFESFDSSGWAEKVLKEWQEELEIKLSKKSRVGSKINFYGKKKPPKIYCNDKQEPDFGPPVILRRK